MTGVARRDEAMLVYLAGDDEVQTTAAQIWDASEHLLEAQRHLEEATNAYTRAITDAGIPAEHIERLGATLILRLHRQRILDETGHAGQDTEPPM